MYPVHPCSPKAAEVIKSESTKASNVKYPFDFLEIGQAFTIPLTGIDNVDKKKEASLRVNASIKAKKHGKTFSVIKHRLEKVIEVARIK